MATAMRAMPMPRPSQAFADSVPHTHPFLDKLTPTNPERGASGLAAGLIYAHLSWDRTDV
ncbi:hypothetical protein [Nocardia tengchongensis]|uniref:hypothetical protein n=1 Tax=Nocardia tengchongensis TaxID=2055889 RepID=UPI00361470A4